MSKKVLIASATAHKDGCKTLLGKSVNYHELTKPSGVELVFKTENKHGLCTVYNDILETYGKRYDVVIFAHDDITIDSINWVERTVQGLEKYDVVGVAGGSRVKTDAPVLWHLMTDQSTHSGIVFHPHPKIRDFNIPTVFGPRPKEVAILDGVFLAVKPKTLKEKGIKFDTVIGGFHHYDIKFCIDCKLKGLKLGTLDINIIHQSPGLTKYNEHFKYSEDYVRGFLEEIKT